VLFSLIASYAVVPRVSLAWIQKSAIDFASGPTPRIDAQPQRWWRLYTAKFLGCLEPTARPFPPLLRCRLSIARWLGLKTGPMRLQGVANFDNPPREPIPISRPSRSDGIVLCDVHGLSRGR
jgi:hypothetical protein